MSYIEKSEHEELLPSFFNSMTDPGIDLTADILELPIDQITENEIIKELPIVGSIVKLGKISLAIRDRFLLKKTIMFISEINNSIYSKKNKDHFYKLQNDKKLMERELEHILFILDRLNHERKSAILANFYIAYMDREIDFNWDDFCTFSEILELFSIYDYKTLLRLEENPLTEEVTINKLALMRLNSLGLVVYFSGIVVTDSSQQFLAKITPVGSLFLKLGFKDLKF